MTQQDWDPGRILKTSGSYWQAFTLQAAIKLDLFTAIGSGAPALDEIATKLEADRRGLSVLLNALAAMGLLIKEGDTYANTDAAASFLTRGSERYLGHIISHHHNLVEAWSKLPRVVKSGEPARSVNIERTDEEIESFIMGMFNMAMNLAPQIADRVDLSGRRHLLDLGGGPGTHAVHFCLKHPELRATIYDLPSTRPFALKTVESFGLADRIDFQEGDYVAGPIKGLYDVAWMSQILHSEGPATCRDIIGKTRAALRPGGLILVHEFILNDTMDGPPFPAVFSLNMLVNTAKGQSYSEMQIREMLTAAGVKNIRRMPIDSPNDSGILQGSVD
jgi:hypothetical protein